MQFIINFHFLRPWLLTLLIPAAVLLWYAWRTQNSRRVRMQSLIAGHLLEHLLVGGGKKQEKIRPLYVLAAFWFIAVIALAGPSWMKESSPFIEDSAGLVIALKVTPTMLALLRWLDYSGLTGSSGSLLSFIELADDPGLGMQIEALETVLYATGKKQQWSGGKLCSAVRQARKKLRRKQQRIEQHSLPPLNP